MTVNHQKQLTVPPFAPSAKSSTIEQPILNEISHDFVDSIPFSSIKENSTNRGQLLGIVRPAWRKVLESEIRLD